jgi:hypothetical protein
MSFDVGELLCRKSGSFKTSKEGELRLQPRRAVTGRKKSVLPPPVRHQDYISCYELESP